MADEKEPSEIENRLSLIAEQQGKLFQQQQVILEQIAESRRLQRKDIWDRLGSIAPILSGAIIAVGGAYFTMAYNHQQLRLQEVQTIEKFIPHLLGDEKSKRAAILAISSLADDELAAKVASIFASPGTVSALESIAAKDPGGGNKALKRTLARALDNMAETFKLDNRYDEAIAAYKKALSLQEQSLGPTSPELIPELNNLAELCMVHKDYAQAELMLKRAADLQKSNSGADSLQYAAQLRRLSSLYKEEGLDSKAQSFMNQAIAIEQKSPGTAGGASIGAAMGASQANDSDNSEASIDAGTGVLSTNSANLTSSSTPDNPKPDQAEAAADHTKGLQPLAPGTLSTNTESNKAARSLETNKSSTGIHLQLPESARSESAKPETGKSMEDTEASLSRTSEH